MADRRTTFIQKYMPYAREASAMTGIDPGVILAQAAHETGWGRKAPGNNFFGIKGKGQSFSTHEYVGGKRVNMKAGFRRYDDPRGSFLDWAKLMQTPRYAKVLAAKTPEEQIKALKAAGYATDPAYVSKLNSVRNQVAGIAGDALTAPAQPGIGGIMDVAALNTAPSFVPDQPTAAQGYAPDLGGLRSSPAQAAIADMLGAPQMTPDQIDQMTMVDEAGNYLNPPGLPPLPSPPPQWANAAGFPIDEAPSGQSAQDVLMGGPRMDPRRVGPASSPMPPDMGAMRSPADVLASGPRLRPGGAPDASMVPAPTISPMRPAVGGPNDRRPQPPTPPSRAQGIPDPRIRPDPASLPQRGFPEFFGEMPPPAPYSPIVAGRPELPAGPMPGAPGMSAAMGGPPAPQPDIAEQMATLPERMGANDLRSGMDSLTAAMDANFYRRQFEREAPQPAWRAPPTATMEQLFSDAAGARSDADQIFGLPPLNDATFPGPPPRIGTVEAGSTGGEFFTPAPPMPAPMPDPLAGRFDDAFSPGGPGMIADLQSVFDARQAPAPATTTAQDGINSVFGAPPAPAMPPNLAIPFNEVPGFGAPPAEAATPALPPMSMGAFDERFGGPPMPPPQPISMSDFNDRFAGGSVIDVPQPGTPGVVQGAMPVPEGAMDIRPPIQGGPPLPPQALPQASPAPAPRQTDMGAQRQRSGIMGRVLGGLLGGPLGALGGGLLGGGGGGFSGFGGQPTFTATGGGTAPYGNGGSTSYQTGTSNALGGSNALSWQTSTGRTITAYTDPNTGQTFHSYGP